MFHRLLKLRQQCGESWVAEKTEHTEWDSFDLNIRAYSTSNYNNMSNGMRFLFEYSPY